MKILGHKVRCGLFTHRVIDLSDIENSLSILTNGQSGNPFSPHYNDQAETYVNGNPGKKYFVQKDDDKTQK